MDNLVSLTGDGVRCMSIPVRNGWSWLDKES